LVPVVGDSNQETHRHYDKSDDHPGTRPQGHMTSNLIGILEYRFLRFLAHELIDVAVAMNLMSAAPIATSDESEWSLPARQWSGNPDERGFIKYKLRIFVWGATRRTSGAQQKYRQVRFQFRV
jgi:hypothetical protein